MRTSPHSANPPAPDADRSAACFPPVRDRARRPRSACQGDQVLRHLAVAHDIDLFLGKIQRRLDAHAQIDQPLDQRMNFPRKVAGQRAHRGTCRRRGLRGDQVSDRFSLHQVQLVVEEGPTRELARFGNPRTELDAARQQHLHHHRSAMPLKLKHILAGEGLRRGKEDQNAPIQRSAVSTQKIAQRGAPGYRLVPGQVPRKSCEPRT
jgi:hypothetical protein